jgi:hypothetical protein
VTASAGWELPAARAVAEAVVDLLEERGLVAAASSSSRVLDAAEVAQLLGRERQWVYDHAGELGAFRYGTVRRHGSASTLTQSSGGSAAARSVRRAPHPPHVGASAVPPPNAPR